MPRRSTISQLPPDVREEIDRLLIDKGFGGYDWAAEQLQEQGVEISRSALHRYGQQLERRLSAIRASTEAARAIASAAPDDSDFRSAAVMGMVQSQLFDVMINLQEADQEQDPAKSIALMANAARAISELSRASVAQKKHAMEIRRQAMVDAADAAGVAATRAGVSPDTIAAIRRDVLGME